MRVWICGNFACGKIFDGQTAKIVDFSNTIEGILGANGVIKSDTDTFFKNPIAFIVKMYKKMSESDTLVVMLNLRGTYILLPIIMLFNCILKRPIRFVLVGMFFDWFVVKHKLYALILKRYNGIYVEKPYTLEVLESQGFTNGRLFPNTRKVFYKPPIDRTVNTPPLKTVFLSRVMQEKGIEWCIDAVNKIANDYGEDFISLDIYGGVQQGYENRFLREIVPSLRRNIIYKGPVELENITKTLSDYHIMLLPTLRDTEGIPGAIVDSYMAGIPVIAPDNLNYCVDNGKTGFLFKFRDYAEFESVLNSVAQNPQSINATRSYCLEYAKKYDSEKVLVGFVEDMEKDLR